MAPIARKHLTWELKTAFSNKSTQKAGAFFETWHRRYATNQIAANSHNDTVRAVYELFGTLFKPDLADHPVQPHPNSPFRYIVIQSKILFYVTTDVLFDQAYTRENAHFFDSEIKHKHYSEIADFRPQILLPGVKNLYMTPDYNNTLDFFLGDVDPLFAEGDILAPERSSEEKINRQEFLESYLLFICGHWGGYWQYDCLPEVSFIIFNQSLDKAVVNLREQAYEGSEKLLYKEISGWTVKRELSKWIE